MPTIDEYLESVSAPQRAAIERVRTIAHDTVPGLEEVVGYHMPGFSSNGVTLLWVGAFNHHLSLFPGTLKFTVDNPLPEATIREFLLRRVAETSSKGGR